MSEDTNHDESTSANSESSESSESTERTESDVHELEAPVYEVTLLEDRAHVYRRGQTELAAGRHTLVVRGVAPVLVDKTLSVAVEAGDGASIVGTRVRRCSLFRSRADDGTEAGALEAQRDALEIEIERLRAEARSVKLEAKALGEIAVMSLQDLSIDTSWGQMPDPSWQARHNETRDRERSLRAEWVVKASDVAELESEHRSLIQRIEIAENPSFDEDTSIEVAVELAEATAVALCLDYVVPGACWRPQHTAELVESTDGADVVRFSTDACVWQNTGEDWTQVTLLFSTERASLGTEPPRLTDDVLRWRKKSDALVVEAREQTVETTGLGGGGGARARELPGIDDGGDTVALRGEHLADVPTDGRPYRVRLSSFESAASVSLVSYPELTPCVLSRVEFTNKGTAPILAGPVELVRSSGHVGRTAVLFIAPEERFALGWGPDSELRVHRDSAVTKDKSRMLSSWVSRRHEVEIHLSNLGDSARTIEITERIPVSEIDKVKIELDADATSRKSSADAQGFVKWAVTLEPAGHESLTLAYLLSRHEDVAGL